jgi:GAF domain-containing protein
VATLVARQPSPAEVFAAVTEEAGKLLHLDSGYLAVFERDGPATVVGAWNPRGAAGSGRHPGAAARSQYHRPRVPTQESARIDDYSDAGGPLAERARSMGIRAAVGSPVLVGGQL